jgi:hypothetical protein
MSRYQWLLDHRPIQPAHVMYPDGIDARAAKAGIGSASPPPRYTFPGHGSTVLGTSCTGRGFRSGRGRNATKARQDRGHPVTVG